MLDPKFVRAQPERIRKAIADKGEAADLDAILRLDEERRALLAQVEARKAERNRSSEEVARLKKAGQDATAIVEAAKGVGEEIRALDEKIRVLDGELEERLLWLPNLPHESVPIGSDSTMNVEVRRWGNLPPDGYTPAPHWQIGAELGILDLERAARISGSGFSLFIGQGAMLQRALIQLMIDLHVTKHGYTEVWAPYLVRRECMTGTGQLPKLEADMYHCAIDDLFLIPTAEVSITNLYRDEVIPSERLPIKLTGHSACFRREAGAAGRDTRGLVRVHQFDKVEMVKLVRPETSYDELESLVRDAEDVLQALDLPYRVLALCAGDLSFAAAKCYDLEVYAPAEQRWLEVSSCSNFEAFQARRMGIRFRNDQGRLEHVHTLNGSGVALPRVVAAILELFQTPRGTVRIPEALRPYLGGREELTPAGP
ncbi:MAG: serine--tRNA ligase [Candidatus Eisenbacteria bacterium]|nr:serine--tRNA ligase [Candidatus Eisenbacteria bacterium]